MYTHRHGATLAAALVRIESQQPEVDGGNPVHCVERRIETLRSSTSHQVPERHVVAERFIALRPVAALRLNVLLLKNVIDDRLLSRKSVYILVVKLNSLCP